MLTSNPTTRVWVNGLQLDQATWYGLRQATPACGIDLLSRVIQGSYNAGGVGASAGTHDGGGAVDVNIAGLTSRQISRVVYAMRKHGFFAAWHRYYIPGLWIAHVHAILMCRQVPVASGAELQQRSYLAGYDGLGNGFQTRDNGPRIPIRWMDYEREVDMTKDEFNAAFPNAMNRWAKSADGRRALCDAVVNTDGVVEVDPSQKDTANWSLGTFIRNIRKNVT